jgi:hypothetical protein
MTSWVRGPGRGDRAEEPWEDGWASVAARDTIKLRFEMFLSGPFFMFCWRSSRPSRTGSFRSDGFISPGGSGAFSRLGFPLLSLSLSVPVTTLSPTPQPVYLVIFTMAGNASVPPTHDPYSLQQSEFDPTYFFQQPSSAAPTAVIAVPDAGPQMSVLTSSTLKRDRDTSSSPPSSGAPGRHVRPSTSNAVIACRQW